MTANEILEKKVTLFGSASNPYPIADITLRAFLYKCYCDETRVLTSPIREEFKLNGKSKRYDELKKGLCAATISGTFSYRNDKSCTSKSGLFAIDIDHPEEDIDSLRKRLYSKPYVFSVLTSCGGDGLWAIIPFNENNDRTKCFNALKHELEEDNIHIDSLGDISRLRFVSYNPNIEVKSEVAVYDNVLETEPVQSISTYIDDILTGFVELPSGVLKCFSEYDDLIDDDLFCAVSADYAINKLGYCSNGVSGSNMNDWLGCIATLSTLGDIGLLLAIEYSRQSPGFKNEREVEKTFNHFIKTGKNANSRSYFTKIFSFLKSKLGAEWVKIINKEISKIPS